MWKLCCSSTTNLVPAFPSNPFIINYLYHQTLYNITTSAGTTIFSRYFFFSIQLPHSVMEILFFLFQGLFWFSISSRVKISNVNRLDSGPVQINIFFDKLQKTSPKFGEECNTSSYPEIRPPSWTQNYLLGQRFVRNKVENGVFMKRLGINLKIYRYLIYSSTCIEIYSKQK